MASGNYDLICIGGGSGGLACAQRAAEYGAKAAVIEQARLGGTCVNVGCVPKKVMWNAAGISSLISDARHYGFKVAHDGHDWDVLKAKRDAYIARLNGIYARNLASKGIDQISGSARFVDARTLEVDGRRLTAPHIVIATGGRPLVPALPGAELGITSDDFFEIAERPRRVAVVGSGYIACELAGAFHELGSEVEMFLRKAQVLRQFDAMLGAIAAARAARARDHSFKSTSCRPHCCPKAAKKPWWRPTAGNFRDSTACCGRSGAFPTPRPWDWSTPACASTSGTS